MSVWRMPVSITSPVMPGPGVNIWHLRNDGSDETAGPELDFLVDVVHDFYNTIASIFHGDTRLSFEGDLWKVGSGDPEIRSGVATWSIVGGTTITPLPPANCLCVSWKTTSPTRSGHGRTFLGPLTQGSVEANGTPIEPHRTMIAGACASLVSTISAPGNGGIGVWSPKQSVMRDFVSGSVANRFAVLRSRRD